MLLVGLDRRKGKGHGKIGRRHFMGAFMGFSCMDDESLLDLLTVVLGLFCVVPTSCLFPENYKS